MRTSGLRRNVAKSSTTATKLIKEANTSLKFNAEFGCTMDKLISLYADVNLKSEPCATTSSAAAGPLYVDAKVTAWRAALECDAPSGYSDGDSWVGSSGSDASPQTPLLKLREPVANETSAAAKKRFLYRSLHVQPQQRLDFAALQGIDKATFADWWGQVMPNYLPMSVHLEPACVVAQMLKLLAKMDREVNWTGPRLAELRCVVGDATSPPSAASIAASPQLRQQWVSAFELVRHFYLADRDTMAKTAF